eukprot:COSAG06_NODE_20734_length_783_cov_2.282164_1_plen_216_part_10
MTMTDHAAEDEDAPTAGTEEAEEAVGAAAAAGCRCPPAVLCQSWVCVGGHGRGITLPRPAAAAPAAATIDAPAPYGSSGGRVEAAVGRPTMVEAVSVASLLWHAREAQDAADAAAAAAVEQEDDEIQGWMRLRMQQQKQQQAAEEEEEEEVHAEAKAEEAAELEAAAAVEEEFLDADRGVQRSLVQAGVLPAFVSQAWRPMPTSDGPTRRREGEGE